MRITGGTAEREEWDKKEESRKGRRGKEEEDKTGI